MQILQIYALQFVDSDIFRSRYVFLPRRRPHRLGPAAASKFKVCLFAQSQTYFGPKKRGAEKKEEKVHLTLCKRQVSKYDAAAGPRR
jgi:hypothetical protein